MTNPNDKQEPTTWLERLVQDESSAQLDSIHEEVVDLFKIINADALDDDERAKMMEEITKVNTNAILMQSPVNDEMMLLHQVSTVGGDILNKIQEHFGLFGSSNTAIPMKFASKALLQSNEVECPSWATLSMVTTEEGVQQAKDANASPVFMTSALSIPPFITKHLLPLNSPSAAKTFVEAQLAAKIFDTEKAPATPASASSMKKILPFLWSAHHGKIKTVPTSPQVSQAIAAACNQMHSIFKENTTTTSNSSSPTNTTDPSVFERMSANLEQMVANNIMAQSTAAPSNKKSFENRLNDTFKTLVLTASAPNSDSIPTEPSESSRSFFEQKNAAEAKAFIFHKLNIVENLPIHLPAGLTTAIWSGVVFWDYLGTPSNFSLFLVPPQSSNQISDTADTIALSLKSSDSRGGIDSDDIKRLTKQKIFIPTSINELEHHINHGLHILAIVFCIFSYLISQLKTVLTHIKMNQATYCDLLRNDNLFAARILYVMDVRIQNFFRSAQQGIFNAATLDFSRMFEEIVDNRTFKAHLPTCIHNNKNKRQEEDNTRNNRRRGEVVRNNNINPQWKCRPDERYGEVFHPHRNRIPKRNNTPICGKMQSLGTCYEGCPFDHNKINRGTPLHTEYTAWVTGCRNGIF